jgi:hypothetical protein
LGGQQSKKATMLANNWDRFGGRALDILNGYVLSIKLDCDFVFYWPEDHRFPEMEEQINFFSQTFIDKFRITTCPTTENIQNFDFNLVSLIEAKKVTSALDGNQFFRNPDFMSLPKFTDEDEVTARRIYSEAAKSIMSQQLLILWSELRKKYFNSNAVHGRFGDLVTGSFNQYVDTGKYIDSHSLKILLEKLTRVDRKIVILSDTPQISKALERLIGVKLLPTETVESKARKLSHFELQTIELFIMASCKSIYASSSSAYSILASRIGNVPIRLIREELNYASVSISWAGNRRAHYSKFSRNIRSLVRSRDLMSILQHYWKNFDFEEVRDFSRDASKVDKEYVLSLCLEAIVAKIDGDSKKAKTKVNKAENLARSRLEIHHDPLLLSLLVKYWLVKKESPLVIEAIKNEIMALSPYQFSKHDALVCILNWEFEKVDNRSESKKVDLETAWNEIVKSDETEILYALLKILIATEFKNA